MSNGQWDMLENEDYRRLRIVFLFLAAVLDKYVEI